MIKIIKEENLLLLEYYPINGIRWIYEAFSKEEPINIKKTYIFEKEDLYIEKNDDDLEFEEDRIVFKFGELEGNYYKIDGEVLSIDINLYIQSNIKITDKFFRAYKNISIFRKINKLVKEDIYIGGDNENLPITAFEELVSTFPNDNELSKYLHARIGSIIRDYFDTSIDAVSIYNKFMNNKQKKHKADDLMGLFSNQEYEKYFLIYKRLKDMLQNEINYNEKQWQKIILEIILLIYPKYIRAFEEVHIKDVYNKKNKRLDYLLVDSNGNIDIIEIKKPYGLNIVSQNKYRDNYIPLRELSGSVMQIEKYIFYLNKWGRSGEEALTKTFKTELPEGFGIKIVNPSGIIIMGRENKLSEEQLADFEVIKRKYKSVIDIITYDELVSRLERMIYKFKTE